MITGKPNQDLSSGKRWGNIPWDKFDGWHVESLIEEMGDIRLDIGMYRRMLKNPEMTEGNKVRLANLINLDTERLYKVKMELENERASNGLDGVQRPGQSSFEL